MIIATIADFRRHVAPFATFRRAAALAAAMFFDDIATMSRHVRPCCRLRRLL